MKLQSHITSEYKGKEYSKYWVNISSKLIKKLKWKKGDELDLQIKDNNLILIKKKRKKLNLPNLNCFLMFFILFLMLLNISQVSATLNAIKVVEDPVCNNGNYISVHLRNDHDTAIDTSSIHIFAMWDGSVPAGNPDIVGEWGADQWNPGEMMSLGIRIQSWFADATDLGMEWLDDSPSGGISGFFENPCESLGMNSESNCVDSDGGEDYYTKGHVTKGNEVKVDTCGVNGLFSLGEYYCDEGEIKLRVYNCDSECKNGACPKNSCGDDVCSPSEENCNTCPEDCGCKKDEECFDFGLTNMGSYCMNFVYLSDLRSPKELTLNFDSPPSSIGLIHIRDSEKDYFWGYDPFWQNGTVLRNWQKDSGTSKSDRAELYEGESITLGLDSFSKEGDDLTVKLLDREGDTIKLLFSKPSNFNFSIPYFYYWLIGLSIILVLILGGFFVFKKNGHSRKESKELEQKRDKQRVEIKEKIPSNITEAISISGLNVKRGSNVILNSVNFSVKRGDFVSLLGPSGCGKSTIIEILAGRRKQTSGSINIFEKKLGMENVNHLIGFVPQGNEVYMNQTVLQNLENSAIKWGIKDAKEKILETLEQVRLSERKNLVASKLSGGQLKLLSLAMELLREPELLILDEPTTGLDPNTRNQIITILSNLSRYDKKTILITTHFMDDAEECDNVIIVDKKRIVANGSPEKLKKMLPGSGRMVTLILDNSEKSILEKLNKTKGIEKIIAEGRTLNILTENPNAVDIANQVHDYGGYVIESKISKATMKEVFVFFTGKNPEE